MIRGVRNLSSDLACPGKESRLEIWLAQYLKLTKKPISEIDMGFARWIIYGFLVYKLLSRDFSSFGVLPAYLLDVYPIDVYGKNYFALFGFWPLTDLFTFHWIHWLLPFPGERVLSAVQWLAIFACGMTAVFGRGPYRVFAISGYVLAIYLWGFLFRSGSDIDAMFLVLSAALIYCFSNHTERLTVTNLHLAGNERTAGAGWLYSAFIMSFIIYYFASGVNKLVDITVLDWFRFDLVQSIGYELDREKLGYTVNVPDIFSHIRHWYFLNYIGVPAVYLSHLLVPLMFFRRSLIPGFWFFYAMFHFLASGVGILFFGNFIVWFVFLPVHRFFEPIRVRYASQGILSSRQASWLSVVDVFNRLEFSEEKTVHAAGGLSVAARNSDDDHEGIRGLRRMMWCLPVAWPILPILYLPGMIQIGIFATGYRKTNGPSAV